MTLWKSLRIGFVLAVGLATYTAWKQLQGDVPSWHVPAATLLWGTIWFTALTMFVASLFERADSEELPSDASPRRHSWLVSAAAFLLLAIYVKSTHSLIDGSGVCESWGYDERRCGTTLTIASVTLLSVASFLFAWFYGWRPAMRSVLNYVAAATVGSAAGAAICLVRGEWNLHIVLVMTLMGALLWLNRRLLFPAMLLDLFDRNPGSR